ncbi:2-iminobutanoate/2-iminopropanoate deaminase [Nocardioides terrae]|uniref:2-iminobutanoate/2-iminopropanoate deaminase n=1 Tax=Nocardioides terrae TaxID=574651 RepID=A0A1I1K809_9ACTN|nr:RidA family protein [Nocardioides terrae]SFC56876.1 2-iminobutanoate/2-iminopropanoate deaminase [Nocardioides terrae]
MNVELIRVGNALDFKDLPLSAACRMGDVVHTAGILPIDPDSGKLVGGSIEEQARLTLTNLVAILERAGSCLAQVGIVRIFLADIARDLAGFNTVYQEFFADHHPARYALGVQLAFPELKVEIQVVAGCPVGERTA